MSFKSTKAFYVHQVKQRQQKNLQMGRLFLRRILPRKLSALFRGTIFSCFEMQKILLGKISNPLEEILQDELKQIKKISRYLWYYRAENVLSRSIRLFSNEKIEEGKFVDMIVQVDISIGSHGRIGFLRDARYFLLPQGSNIKEGCEK